MFTMNFDSESWFQRAKSKKISEKRCSRQRIENPKNGKRPIVETIFGNNKKKLLNFQAALNVLSSSLFGCLAADI